MSQAETVSMRIQWKDDTSEAVKTFALIPDEWKGKDLSNHPQDAEVFYWLEPAEWIALGAGETYADFDIVGCGCEECETELAESEGADTSGIVETFLSVFGKEVNA